MKQKKVEISEEILNFGYDNILIENISDIIEPYKNKYKKFEIGICFVNYDYTLCLYGIRMETNLEYKARTSKYNKQTHEQNIKGLNKVKKLLNDMPSLKNFVKIKE
jgi:hypothetical protein